MTEDGAPQQALRNIEDVLRLEQEQGRHRPPFSRLAAFVARFAGSAGFVGLHLILIAGWAAVNAGLVPGLAPFDPFPFGLLGAAFSLEGVLLAAFVLAKQNRMSARDEERAHLDLQISLLAEQEVTKVIQMLERISVAIGVEREVLDRETEELGRTTAVGGLAKRLHDRLRPGER
ncbi:DUF1003 domain-containing protein [Falsiroseomonas sp.]|uniref:DUF1003 domain-containing protein n=1 Tax=Falsiroseomonas sp. TaxID=2870721 RepID=UPI0035684F4A